MASEDLCIVCADPLQWTAYGPCGHRDTCSRCVTRMRSVLKDDRCCYCQQPLPAAFVTRFLGDYTQQLPAADFDGALQERAKAGQLHYLESAQAYFDDAGHFREISNLCSYTHPAVWEEKDADGRHKTFRSLQALKQHLQQRHNLQFCNICLEGRKVFLAEQCVYSKSELDRHMKTGDLEGPLAESGFKGHPECRFCRKRFYGENEIYTHMHTRHEQCFLCKRANPNRFVYYRDYPDLENHFRHDHFLCRSESCLEKKFVVFASEQELKQHMAREHAGDMSKAEKRQALTIPVNFSYRHGEQPSGSANSSANAGAGASGASHELAAAAAMGRAIMIGGGAPGAGAGSRFGRRGGGSRGNLREEHQQTAQAVQASLESAQTETALRQSTSQPNLQGREGGAVPAGQEGGGGRAPALTEADFPLPAGASGPGRGAAVGGQWAGAGSSGIGGALRAEDFPALPGMSKAAKKRAKGKKSMAELLGAGGAGAVRVINAGAGARPGPPSLGAAAFPSLRQSSSMPSLNPDAPGPPGEAPREPEWQEVAPPRLSQRQLAAQQKLKARQAKEKKQRGAAAAGKATSSAWQRPEGDEQQQQPQQQQQGEGGGGSLRQGARAPTPVAATSASETESDSEQQRRQQRKRQERIDRQQERQQDAFPALPGQQRQPVPAPAPTSTAGPPAAAAAGSVGGISEGLKAANKALVERIKRQLGPAEFATFRQNSMDWMRGETESLEYHQQVTALGLLSLVPDLAATCPDAQKRAELLAVHAAAFANGAQGGAAGRWVPPEAAAAAAAHAEQFSSWECGTCTLLNAPGARTCEACGHPKPRPDLDASNQWKQQQQQQAGQGAAALVSGVEDDPSLPPLQQAGAVKGRKGGKAGAAAGAGSSAEAFPQRPPEQPVSFSVAAAAARAAPAAAASSGAAANAGSSRPASPLENFPALGGSTAAFPALGGGALAGDAAQPSREQEDGYSEGEDGAAAAGGGSSSSSSKKGKQKKQPKFERLRITGGDPATKQWLEQESRKVHPQNAWTRGGPPAAGQPAAAAPLAQGPWGGKGAGKLAQQERALLDAWGSKS